MAGSDVPAHGAASPAQAPARPPRSFRRWLALSVAALGLLAASQLIWQWETWPVRQLLGAASPVKAAQ